MKKNLFNTLILLLISTSVVFAASIDPQRFYGRVTKEKKISKEFTVNPNALLKIENSYGDVKITSWNENRVVIVVVIRTNGNDEDKVAERLHEIDVEFEASAGLVSATTQIEKQNRSWWNTLTSGNDNVNLEINYTIKVPVKNSVDLNNDYGGIYLNRIEGQAKITCDYGHLEIGELLANNNSLDFDYTNNSTIAYMRGGRIHADYSSFILEKADKLELNADYSKSTFKNVKELNFTCDYGNLTAENVDRIAGRGDYLSLRLGDVNGDVNLNADYGSIKIDRLTAKAGNVTIKTDYAGVRIGYAPDYDFTFNISLEYAALNGEEGLEITKKRIQSTDKYYEGYHGSSSATKNITIDTEYGGVTFSRSN